MPKAGQRRILHDSIRELRSTAQAANKLVPGCVLVTILLAAGVVVVALLSVQLMMAVIILVVLFSSIGVYSQAKNYGEAALALVAGLLTAFTVEWTAGRFIVFIMAWISLSLAALLISSVRLAAAVQEIYFDAAQKIDPQKPGSVQVQLEEIGKDKFIRMLGPIERAEVIRLFAFRQLPIPSMQYALRAVEMLSTVTRVDHRSVADFVIDIYKMFKSTPGPRYQALLDKIYAIIRASPVSPSEFILAFRGSRHLALSGALDPDTYFTDLTAALEGGVPPEQVYEHLQARVGREL